jgi:cell division protein FtsQ
VLKVRTRPAPPEQTEQETRKKFLRRQRARRFHVWRRLLLALAVVGLLVGAVWLVFFSPVLAVKGVEVTGASVLTEREVTDAADVPFGVPLATADLDAAAARVEDLAPVASVEVTRAWPNHVHIEVTERQAVAVASWEGEWRGLDKAGVLFRSYPTRPTGLPRVTMHAATQIEVLAEAAAVVTALPADILARVEYVDVGSIDSISLHLRSGAVVNWGSADQSADKAAVLEVLLEKKARTYDVTAPGRPTLTP